MYYVNPPVICDSGPFGKVLPASNVIIRSVINLEFSIIYVLYGNKKYLNDSQKKYFEEGWSYSLPEFQVLGHRRDIVATLKILPFSEKV